ncbi:hypothetical protein [Trueperella abortisuis]|uniref:hypothetical protein n=1 Tax=Trueperella abortisuis TaxID=445930 RepID=UPI0028936BF0|nr:hypothetical protein [Trueperella abortisuis]
MPVILKRIAYFLTLATVSLLIVASKSLVTGDSPIVTLHDNTWAIICVLLGAGVLSAAYDPQRDVPDTTKRRQLLIFSGISAVVLIAIALVFVFL